MADVPAIWYEIRWSKLSRKDPFCNVALVDSRGHPDYIYFPSDGASIHGSRKAGECPICGGKHREEDCWI